ncbi:MAG: caspase family protein [Pseudomonadota bacterium]|nr:caspase family protein [Pseudomonadota bacterium]
MRSALCGFVAVLAAQLTLAALPAKAEPRFSPQRLQLAQQYYYSPFFSPYQQPEPQVRRFRRPPVAAPAPQPLCEAPMVYSHGLKKCICVAEGHGLVDDKCVQLAQACDETKRWSPAEQKCVCRAGHVPQGDQCIHPQLHAGIDRKPGEEPLLTSDMALIQRCMIEAGYLKGEPAATPTSAFWTAFWFFKKDYNVAASTKGALELKTQLRLFDLCPETQRELGTYVASARPADPVTGEGSTPAQPRLFAAAEAQCLPPDLMELVTGAYGARPQLKACHDNCLPVPRELGPKEIASYEANRVVEWCKSCLQINSHLPLDDILLIERETNVSLCSRPPTQLPRWSQPGAAGRAAFTRVRELYRPFSNGLGHEKDFAVVIGNKSYRGGIEVNGSAHNNAGAFYALLTEHLGIKAENVIDLRDASLDDFRRVFGDGGAGELAAALKRRGAERLFIYFAGHGATLPDQSERFLLPVDTLPHRAAQTGYPLSTLYDRVAALGMKSSLVLLEAEFGRDISDIVYPPNLPAMRTSVLPRSPSPGLTVMAAASGDQRTIDDPRYGIGLFTRYLIEGLAGRADLAPIGNADNAVDAVELYAYTAHMVRLAARKSFGLLQQPVTQNGGNPQLSRKQAQGN